MGTELAVIGSFVVLCLPQALKLVGWVRGCGQPNLLALNERWRAFGHKTPRNGAKTSEYWTYIGLLGVIRV